MPAAPLGAPAGAGEHSGREVDAYDAARRADGLDEVRQVDAGAAGQIDSGIAGAQAERADGAAVEAACSGEIVDPGDRVVGRSEPVVEASDLVRVQNVGSVGAKDPPADQGGTGGGENERAEAFGRIRHEGQWSCSVSSPRLRKLLSAKTPWVTTRSPADSPDATATRSAVASPSATSRRAYVRASPPTGT